MTALARCTKVGRTYGTGAGAVVALYGATCTVQPGARIAIVGPSGSGKSTLLHILAGLETPSAGTVEWPGLGGSPRDVAHQVGLVFQAPTLVPSLTVRENIELPLRLADADESQVRERVDEAMDLLEIAGLAQQLPQELSGGQAQRSVIARVLAARPAFILADEPTSQLDRRTADHVVDVLLRVCDWLGAALVVATHDSLISDRMNDVWPIDDGRLRCPVNVDAPGTGELL